MGVIPITSRWGAIDNIEHYGYLLPELSVEAIGKGVEWASMLPPGQISQINKGKYILFNSNVES